MEFLQAQAQKKVRVGWGRGVGRMHSAGSKGPSCYRVCLGDTRYRIIFRNGRPWLCGWTLGRDTLNGPMPAIRGLCLQQIFFREESYIPIGDECNLFCFRISPLDQDSNAFSGKSWLPMTTHIETSLTPVIDAPSLRNKPKYEKEKNKNKNEWCSFRTSFTGYPPSPLPVVCKI